MWTPKTPQKGEDSHCHNNDNDNHHGNHSNKDNNTNNNNHTCREASVFPVHSVLSFASGCVDAVLNSALMQKIEVAEALADLESCFALD